MNNHNNQHRSIAPDCVGLGIALGAAFGAAVDNIGLGVALGVAIGAGINATLELKRQREEEK